MEPALFRWPISMLRFKDPITAGMDPYVLLGMVPVLRKTAQDHGPVEVGPACPTCRTRTVLEGRHRWIGYVMAGRHDLPVEENPEWIDRWEVE